MNLDATNALNQGINAQNNGQFHEAERLYRLVLLSEPNNSDAKDFNIFHLLKVFFVILPLRSKNGNFSFLIFKKKLGQISESTKDIRSGFQFLKKLFINRLESYGKNWWKTLLLSLYFFWNWENELKVTVVIKKLYFFLWIYIFSP